MWGGILGISPDHLHLQIAAEEPRWPPPSIRTEYLFSRVEVAFGKLLVFPWHYMRSRCKASVCLWWFDQLYLIDIPASDWPECWPRLSNAPLFCLTRLTLLRHNTSILSQSLSQRKYLRPQSLQIREGWLITPTGDLYCPAVLGRHFYF